ncbi:MAG: hypothetical protein V1821_04220 [bacterium]
MAPSLSKDFIKKMETALQEEKVKLEQELSQMAMRDPKNPSTFVTNFPDMGTGEDENAAEVANYSDNLAVTQQLENALKDVLKAIERVKKGVYGVCIYCKQTIDERRLTARPTSSSCIACKKKLTQEL